MKVNVICMASVGYLRCGGKIIPLHLIVDIDLECNHGETDRVCISAKDTKYWFYGTDADDIRKFFNDFRETTNEDNW